MNIEKTAQLLQLNFNQTIKLKQTKLLVIRNEYKLLKIKIYEYMKDTKRQIT